MLAEAAAATQPQLITPATIATAGVATLAINAVTNTFYRLLKFPPKWTAFVTALVVAGILVGIQDKRHWYDWFLGFLNACLLFCSALGVNEAAAAATTPPGQGAAAAQPLVKSWIKR
jgi:Mn2+/Fe2+ NRAMP family transporter